MDKGQTFSEHRQISRQTQVGPELDINQVGAALNSLQSSQEQIKMNSLCFFKEILLSNYSDTVIRKYGDEAKIFFLDIAEYGLTQEIQEIALRCLTLCYRNQYLSIEPIIRESFVALLVDQRLTRSIQEANCALALLSIATSENSEIIHILIAHNIFQILLNMPPDYNFGELVLIILRHISDPTIPEVQAINALIPLMLQSSSEENVCHGLLCIGTFLDRSWAVFDFDSFHSSFWHFLTSEKSKIVSTAFDILRKFPPSPDDSRAILECISRGGDNAYYPIAFLADTISAWANSPPSQLIQCLFECFSKSKYNIISSGMRLLIPALSAPGAPIDEGVLQSMIGFLQDERHSKTIIIGICIIWDKVQPTGGAEWFINQVTRCDREIEEMVSSEDETIAKCAQKLLEIMEQ